MFCKRLDARRPTTAKCSISLKMRTGHRFVRLHTEHRKAPRNGNRVENPDWLFVSLIKVLEEEYKKCYVYYGKTCLLFTSQTPVRKLVVHTAPL